MKGGRIVNHICQLQAKQGAQLQLNSLCSIVLFSISMVKIALHLKMLEHLIWAFVIVKVKSRLPIRERLEKGLKKLYIEWKITRVKETVHTYLHNRNSKCPSKNRCFIHEIRALSVNLSTTVEKLINRREKPLNGVVFQNKFVLFYELMRIRKQERAKECPILKINSYFF